MKKKKCSFELEIMTGLKEKELGPELQKHVSTCSVCKNVVAVHTWMNTFQEKSLTADIEKKVLPDAESVRKRGQSLRRVDEKIVRKAMRPLIYPQVLSFLVFLIGGIFLGAKGVFKSGDIFNTPTITRILPFILILMSLVFISLMLLAFLILFEKRKKTRFTSFRQI